MGADIVNQAMAGLFMPSLRVMVRDCAWAGYGCVAACVPFRES